MRVFTFPKLNCVLESQHSVRVFRGRGFILLSGSASNLSLIASLDAEEDLIPLIDRSG